MAIELKEFGQGYRPRTIYNAQMSDLTFAFAFNFETAGERLTARAAGSKLLQISMEKSMEEAQSMIRDSLSGFELILNIAGNGIGSLMNKFRHTNPPVWKVQLGVDQYIYTALQPFSGFIKTIRSGGQTGADEAGAKAGQKLGKTTIVTMPIGFLYRDATGRDHEATREATILRLTP